MLPLCDVVHSIIKSIKDGGDVAKYYFLSPVVLFITMVSDVYSMCVSLVFTHTSVSLCLSVCLFVCLFPSSFLPPSLPPSSLSHTHTHSHFLSSLLIVISDLPSLIIDNSNYVHGVWEEERGKVIRSAHSFLADVGFILCNEIQNVNTNFRRQWSKNVHD